MVRNLLPAIALLAVCAVFCVSTDVYAAQARSKVVRVAVIGGMSVTTDLWKEIAAMFEADTGYAVDLVAAGPKHGLADSMKQGRVDLLTMHSSDTTTDLVADGFAVNLRPWAKNDLVILGPPSDPAKIAGMTDGAEALKKIAATRSRYVELQGIGKRGLAHLLWKRAGVQPKGSWYMKDESENHDDLLRFVARHKAYAIFGRIPVVMGKIDSGKLKILVDRDPTMRRPYVVMEVNPAMFPDSNVQGARALSDYLLSEKVQNFLLSYGKERNNGIPFFHPVTLKRSVAGI
jgi:tungstate transport system substrate-binding protein